LVAEARDRQARGQVEKIGVSVYTAEEIEVVMEALRPELIQVPVSVFDQRLLRSGHLRALKASGVEVHARSIFLQGLLLMEPEALPVGLERARAPLESFRALARSQSLTLVESALGFVLGLPEVDVAICGVNSSGHLGEICSQAKPLRPEAFRDIAVEDPFLVNPSQWGIGK
jgi:aryl-alcohol dehydrogenase-like predicted oxidoreductase